MSSKPVHRGEIYSGPDSLGRHSFALFWMADYHPGHPDGEHGWRERGQHYFGRLREGVEYDDHRIALG